LVGSVIVVVAAVGGQELSCVGVVEDEQVVTELVAHGADDSFAVRVHAGCAARGGQDVDRVGLEDRVERGGVLVVSVAQQKTQ
jgi:hypothetical protein